MRVINRGSCVGSSCGNSAYKHTADMVSLVLADALVMPCSTGGFGLGLRAATTAFPSSACPRAAPLSLRCTPAASTTISGAGRGGALLTRNFAPSNNTIYKVNDFMTKRDDLIVVRPTTTVDKALELLVKNRISGFPVVDDDWRLVGVVSDYDLLALDSISGCGRRNDADLFPMVDSSWQTFNEIQKLLGKTNGKVVRDLMTPAPLFVHETTNLEDAARLLLETKHRRLPVVGGDGGLVGIITRGHVVRAALKIRRQMGKMTSS